MEYFDSGQFYDFSVQDIFESEVKSEIDELLSTDTTQFAQETVTNMDLGTALSPQDMGVEITELQAWSDALGSLNEAESVCSATNNSVNLSGSADKFGLDSFTGQTQTHILVDPQTGLPTSLSQATLGGTHIHAQQVNLFVNSASSQLQQQALRQQQGLDNINVAKDISGLGLEQFNHTNMNSTVNNSHLLVRPVQPANVRQFTHYQLQNGQGQTLVSQHKIKNSHKCAHNSILKAAKHHPYTTVKSHSKKIAKGTKTIKMEAGLIKPEKVWAKPCYSYSCLITMALKNSKAGCLPVSEIYHFMYENFPYFKTAKDGWKNSVRHNLSLNKCFAKVDTGAVPNAKSGKKGCLWAMNPEKFAKMEEEVHKSTKRDPVGIQMCMAKPEDFPKIEALSRLTHPKNLKDAARIRESLHTVSKKPAYHLSHVVSVKAEKVKPPTTTMAKAAARVPTPVSVKKVDISSLDLFQQDLNALSESTFLPIDMGASLQNSHNEVFPYDTVEIIPCSNPRTTLSRSASNMSDISPYKDSSQSVNSMILGLDKSPITTLAHTHFSGLEQASRRLEAFL